MLIFRGKGGTDLAPAAVIIPVMCVCSFATQPWAQTATWPFGEDETPQAGTDGITFAFGPRLLPTQAGGMRYDFHAGLDFEAPAGADIGAILSGEVIAINPIGLSYRYSLDGGLTPGPIPPGQSTAAGNQVIVRTFAEDGRELWLVYDHLDQISVGEGDIVELDDTVGTVGATGTFNNSNPHLHLTLLVDRQFPENRWSNEIFAENPLQLFELPVARHITSGFGVANVTNYVNPNGPDGPGDFTRGGAVAGQVLTGQAVQLTFSNQYTIMDRIVVSGDSVSRELNYSEIVGSQNPSERDLQFQQGFVLGVSDVVGTGLDRSHTVTFMPGDYDRTDEPQVGGGSEPVSYTTFAPDRVEVFDLYGAQIYDGLGGSNVLSQTSVYQMNFERTLDLNGFDQIIGGLAGSGLVRLGDATLNLQNNGQTLFSGEISGTGDLSIRGNGTTTLTGENTFAGDTHLLSGTLNLLGSLNGDVSVEGTSHLLAFGGEVGGSVYAADNATIQPGSNNQIGTLRIAGDYSHEQGATILVNADDAGQASMLDIDGTATLLGGTVEIDAIGTFDFSQRYSILHADGGVIGAFDTVLVDLPFLDASLDYSVATEVSLQLTRAGAPPDFGTTALTENQLQFADYLASNQFDRGVQPVVDAILPLSTAQSRLAYSQAGGFHSATGWATLVDLNQDQLHDTLRNLAEYRLAAPVQVTQAGNGPQSALFFSNIWFDTAYATVSMAAQPDLDFQGLDSTMQTIRFGADLFDAYGFDFGLMGTYSTGDVEFGLNAGEISSRSSSFGLTAMRETDRGYVTAATLYGLHNVNDFRSISLPAVAEVASSQYFAQSIDFFLGTTLHDVAPNARFSLSPSLNISAQALWVEGHTETGAGAFNLRRDSVVSWEVATSLGLDATWSPYVLNGLTLSGSVQWDHNLMNHDETHRASLAAASSGSYSFRPAIVPGDLIDVQLGVGTAFGESGAVRFVVGGRSTLSSELSSLQFSLSGGWSF